MNETVENPEVDVDMPDDVKGRQRSTIAFPYSDFQTAEAMAQSIYANAGNGDFALHQLAPWMNLSAKSSGFRTQLATARLFGLIQGDNAERYRLTELGARLIDPAQMRAAKAEAFLKVPLFKALFEKYKGQLIPPHQALEHEIVALGVSEKQKGRARQIFDNSAEQTGFKAHGVNRLVMPAVATAPTSEELPQGKSAVADGASQLGPALDPLLLALLQKIPAQGESWPAEKRLRWFRTFAMNVSQVYDTDESPVELKIEIEK